MAKYDDIVRMTKQAYGVRVRRWRRQMSGAAWRVDHADGRAIHWIESPRPRSPLSLAIFLHEVGHHVLGFDRYDVRCEDEYQNVPRPDNAKAHDAYYSQVQWMISEVLDCLRSTPLQAWSAVESPK